MFPTLLTIATVGLLVFALIDVITANESQFRTLDKMSWVFIVILLPIIGSILWLTLGKQRARPSAASDPPPAESSPEDDAAAIQREIEFTEREARIRRLEAELKEKRDNP